MKSNKNNKNILIYCS